MQNQQYSGNQGGHVNKNQQQQYYQQQQQMHGNQYYVQEFQGQNNVQGYYDLPQNNNGSFVNQSQISSQRSGNSDRSKQQIEKQNYEMHVAAAQMAVSNEHSYRSAASGKHPQQVYARQEPMMLQQQYPQQNQQIGGGKPPPRAQQQHHPSQGQIIVEHGGYQHQYNNNQNVIMQNNNLMPALPDQMNINPNSNRSNTANTQFTNKTSKSSNAAGQGKNSKRSKKKNSGRQTGPPRAIPPPKVEIQQPNFHGKNGEYSNSNSRSDYYEDSEEKVSKRGAPAQIIPGGPAQIINSGRGVATAVPHPMQQQIEQPFHPNPDSYRNESYSMLYQNPNQNSVDMVNNSYMGDNVPLQQNRIANNNLQPPQSTIQEQQQVEEDSVDSQEIRDQEFMNEWAFAGATHEEVTPAVEVGVEQVNFHPEQDPAILMENNDMSTSQISSIRAHQAQQEHHAQNQGPPPYQVGNYVNQSNMIQDEGSLPPAVRAVDDEIRGSLMNDPGLNLDDIQQMNPIQAMINQKSEYSGSNSSDLNDSRNRRKQRMLKKYRGAKAAKSKQNRDQKIRKSNQRGSRRSHRSQRSMDSGNYIKQNDRSQRSYVSSSYSSSDESDEDGSMSDGVGDSSDTSGSGNSLIFHDDPAAEADQQHGPNNMNAYYGNNSGNGIPQIPGQPFGNMRNDAYNNPQGRASHLMPIQFAKEHIIKIEEDMKKMHERHVRLMREMDENYKLIEQETQEYYIEFLQKWKEVAKQKIQQYRKTTETLALEKDKIVKEKDAQVDLLNEQKTKLLKEKERLLKEHSESIWIRDTEHERQKGEFEAKLKKKEEESSKVTYRKLAQELMQVYNIMDIEQLQSLLNEQNVNVSVSSETDVTQMSSKISKQLDKKFKVLIQAEERTQYEEYIISSVSYLLQLIFNENSKNQNLQEKMKELQEQHNIEKEQLQIDISDLNSQREHFSSQDQSNKRNLDDYKNLLQNSQADNMKLEQQIKSLQLSVKERDERIQQQDGKLELQITNIKNLEKQIGVFQQAQNTQSSLASAAEANQDQGQSSQVSQIRPSEQALRPAATDSANQSQNQSLMQKFKQSNLKIRFATGERGQSDNRENNSQSTIPKTSGIKIKGLGQGNKNFVIKPTSIMGGNSSFHSAISKPKNIIVVPPMSEQGYKDKTDGIIKNYSSKIQEIEELRNHLNTRLADQNQQNSEQNDQGNPDSYDRKILTRLQIEESTYKQNMEDELAKLKKTYEQAQKNEILTKNIQNNRTSSMSSAKQYTTEASDMSKVNPMQINLKNIKNKLQKNGENPYRNKSRGQDLNQSTVSSQMDLNKSVIEGSSGLNISAVAPSGGQFSLQKNFHSVNSARDLDGKNDKLISKLREQIADIEVQNSNLKQQITNLNAEVRQSQNALSDMQAIHAQCGSAGDSKNVEILQKELDDLKEQTSVKKLEYSKNLQFAKSRMDLLKGQIEKLKLIVQQAREEKTQYKGQIKSLESVNAKIKAQIEDVRQESKGELVALRNQKVEMHSQIERLWAKYQTETLQRKKLHNTIEDMKGKIRVYCRVRPMNNNEIKMGCIDAITIVDQFTLKIRVKKDQQMFKQNQIQASNVSSQSGAYQEKEFVYDACFGSMTKQEEIFEDTKMLIQSGIDGFNVCIFAYGQTGSGKTYTVNGTQENMGIVPRSFMEMFNIKQKMEKDNHFVVKFECYMVELYLDKLNDLLTGGSKNVNQSSTKNNDKLEIREDTKTGLVYIQNAKQKTLNSFQEAMDTFDSGLRSRKVQSTEMNDLSSRSHLIFGIVIETKNNNTGELSRGKISFVDLAGSERLSKSNPKNNIERQRESNAINLSLKYLGDVIQGLSNGNVDKSHIPYRSNKLTHLMKDSLGGNSKTLMFVNISPADYNSSESEYSLRFGNRVKMIQNDVTKNVESEQIQRLKEDNEQLRKKLGYQ